MAAVVFRKKGMKLLPVDSDGLELLGRLRENRDVLVEVTQSRNPRHHRLYWALVKFVSEHSPLFEDVSREEINVAIKLATGHVNTFVDKDTGSVCYVPRSISWAAMDQTEFFPFFDAACGVIANRWMPAGTTADTVRDELIRMVDGPHALWSRTR